MKNKSTSKKIDDANATRWEPIAREIDRICAIVLDEAMRLERAEDLAGIVGDILVGNIEASRKVA